MRESRRRFQNSGNQKNTMKSPTFFPGRCLITKAGSSWSFPCMCSKLLLCLATYSKLKARTPHSVLSKYHGSVRSARTRFCTQTGAGPRPYPCTRSTKKKCTQLITSIHMRDCHSSGRATRSGRHRPEYDITCMIQVRWLSRSAVVTQKRTVAIGDVSLEVKPPANPELVPVGWGLAENEHQDNLEHCACIHIYMHAYMYMHTYIMCVMLTYACAHSCMHTYVHKDLYA
jgi:hypothetical protein